MYPTGCSPQILWATQIQQLDTPLRPIVSSCGSVTYGVAEELTKILKPLVGKSPHHMNNTHDFCGTGQAHYFSTLRIPQLLWCVCPVHISPSRSSLKGYQGSTGKDPTLKDRRVLPVEDIILLLLEFCLKNIQRPVLWTGRGVQLWVPQSSPL